jgi:sterol desaturase/sphingolipid hydroxylase (fatty acid hydroxylase superfamily)
MLPQSSSGSVHFDPNEDRCVERRTASLHPGLVIVAVFLAADLCVFVILRSRWPGAWGHVRRSLLGPGFGVREGFARYAWTLASVLMVDLVVLRRRSALACLWRFGRSERLDLFMFALRRIGLSLTMPVLLSAGILSVVLGFVSSRRHPLGNLPSPVFRVVVVIVLLDFLRYWLHRFQHEIDVLWRFHALHHSATSFTLTTGVRVHPVDQLLDTLTAAVVFGMFGVTATSIAWLAIAKMAVDFAQHSMVPLTYGAVGQWLVYSPIGHRIHHSPLPEHWDRNYGDLMPIWDRLFGTWYSGSTLNESVGLAGAHHVQDGVVASIVRPFGAASRSIARFARTGEWRPAHRYAACSRELPHRTDLGATAHETMTPHAANARM